MHSSSHWYSILVALAAVCLTGCDDGNGSDEDAQIRMLNVSPGYASLDLYANGEDDDTDKLRVAGVGTDTVSSYTRLESGTYAVKFKRNNVSSTLQTLSGRKFADDTHRTFVAFGSTGNFSAVELDEDLGEPDGGRTTVRLINAAEAGSLDVYLTESSVPLDDASPVFSAIASSATGSPTGIDSGDYRLRVTGASDKNDLRLDVPNVSFGSKKVVTLVLTATQGGVLVNVQVLPQQGSVTKHANTKARVRGAVGIANGTAVTARIGGVTLLTGSAIGVVGNYAQVDAGTAAVNLTVNGTAVAAPDQTLTAGGDYTLLIWNTPDGTQATLIGDDNRLPTTSGRAKIRVVNGLSALRVPITLSVDFSPVAEGIALGQASGFTEVDGGSEYQLDVTNTDTAANLLSRSSVSLQAAGVYTMFMWVNGTTVGGTLRKDR